MWFRAGDRILDHRALWVRRDDHDVREWVVRSRLQRHARRRMRPASQIDMTRSTTVVRLAAGLATLAALAWFFARRDHPHVGVEEARERATLASPERSTAQDSDSASSPRIAAARAPSDAPGNADTSRTARDILESLWGPLSPAQETRLADEGIELDARCSIPEWSTVETAMRSRLVELSSSNAKNQREDWGTVLSSL